uniref:Uncharacterized protein n=1 Tax=Rhizoctonia cerealis orthocurvulavirus TaxID=3068670 RepID=A0AA51BS88_9VIRU|nr:MAG: hypothetical protein [Rhizoctonia cerealis orthocurvulavirus]
MRSLANSLNNSNRRALCNRQPAHLVFQLKHYNNFTPMANTFDSDIAAFRRVNTDSTPKNLMEVAGVQTKEVDFEQRPNRPEEVLPVPEEGDSLETLYRKADALAKIVEDGRSLAIYTGFKQTSLGSVDPVEAARRSFTAAEERLWDAWCEGSALPQPDWNQAPSNPRESDGKREQLAKWAHALNIIYKRTDLEGRHVTQFKKELEPLIPLVTAMMGVISAKRGLLSGTTKLTEMEMAEYQTARKIASTVSDETNKIMRAIKEATNRLHQRNQVLQERVRQLGNKLGVNDRGDGPVNKERAILGKRRIAATFDTDHGPAEGREKRTRGDIERAIGAIQAPAPRGPQPSGSRGRVVGGQGLPSWQGTPGLASGATGGQAGVGGQRASSPLAYRPMSPIMPAAPAVVRSMDTEE